MGVINPLDGLHFDNHPALDEEIGLVVLGPGLLESIPPNLSERMPSWT